MLSIFSYTSWLFVDHLWGSIYLDPLPILKLGYLSFELFHMFWIQISYQIYMKCKYFFPFFGLPLHFLNDAL